MWKLEIKIEENVKYGVTITPQALAENPAPLAQQQYREPTPAVPSDDEDRFEAENAFSAISSEPRSLAEALKCPDPEEWRRAAMEELQAHELNGTWKLIELPAGKKAIGSRWVFKLKHNAGGSIDHHKGRLVAKGYNQQPGFDYLKIFAPTVRLTIIRFVLALAAIHDLHLCSIDISHAYLDCDMDVEIYMEQPEGFHQGGPKTVCKLIHSIYGSKQGGRMWNKKMHSVLSEMSFKCTYPDHSLYIYTCGHVRIFLQVFVDDMSLALASKDVLEQVGADLSKHFKLRDLGETTQLLGIKIDRDRPTHTISPSQWHYTRE